MCRRDLTIGNHLKGEDITKKNKKQKELNQRFIKHTRLLVRLSIWLW